MAAQKLIFKIKNSFINVIINYVIIKDKFLEMHIKKFN